MAASFDTAAAATVAPGSAKRKAASTSSSETEEEEEEEELIPTPSACPPSAAIGSSASAVAPTVNTPTVMDSNKKQELASIFTMGKATGPSDPSSSSSASSSSDFSGQFVWHDKLGPRASCLHGSYRHPSPSTKLALFDLDGTLVRPKSNAKWPSATNEHDFRFCYPGVIDKVQQAYQEGFAVVIVSNQKQTPQSGAARLKTWSKKIVHIARALDVPLRVFAALAADGYRKPCLGIWHELRDKLNGDMQIDLAASYYVGDAAGRKSIGGKDHSDTDLKWALNAGLSFQTPEQFFLGKNELLKPPPYPWLAKPDSFDRLPIFDGTGKEADDSDSLFYPSDTPLVPDDERTEVILFVGSPASGKTAFYRRHLQPAGYEWINQDTLKTRDKCVSAVRKCLEEGRSCVVDNTNRDRATRKHYIDLATTSCTPIRCFFFDIAKATCLHNNAFRAMGGALVDEPRRDLVPAFAIDSFYKQVQRPKKEEGFAEEPKRIKWRFEGDEVLRKEYELYYT